MVESAAAIAAERSDRTGDASEIWRRLRSSALDLDGAESAISPVQLLGR